MQKFRRILIMLIFTSLIILYNIDEVDNSIIMEQPKQLYIVPTVEEIVEDLNEIKIETSLDNLKFVVDITNIEVGIDGYNFKLIGNTANSNAYSGEIYILTNKLDGIQLYNTYTIITEPLMSFTSPPVVIEISRYKASELDIYNLHKSREVVSNYKVFMQNNKNIKLDELIEKANDNYMLWTNEQIIEYEKYIKKKGYSEDKNTKSFVKIISEPYTLN